MVLASNEYDNSEGGDKMTDREMLLMAYTAMALMDEKIDSDVFHQLCAEVEGHLWPPVLGEEQKNNEGRPAPLPVSSNGVPR